MSVWSQKKQITYLSIVFAFLLVVIVVPVYFLFFNVKPTCSDGFMNQNEEGVDCGGECSKVCPDQTLSAIIMWERYFKVTKGYYSAVAMIENPNVNAMAQQVPYVFTLYDKEGAVIAQRQGSTFMYPSTKFPIFVSDLVTGERTPVRVTFEFKNSPLWQRQAHTVPVLNITDQILTTPETTPRVDATLLNTEDYTVTKIEVVAVVYDENDNAIAASNTFIDSLPARGSAKLYFTWPEPFTSRISKIILTPKTLPRFITN